LSVVRMNQQQKQILILKFKILGEKDYKIVQSMNEH